MTLAPIIILIVFISYKLILKKGLSVNSLLYSSVVLLLRTHWGSRVVIMNTVDPVSKSQTGSSVVNGLGAEQLHLAMSRTSQHSKKRNELQGLRALAIIAVLFYHVWPELFCNGYLGVDM